MDAIASTAGVSKGTLYARYPTKDALRQAVIIEELARLDESAKARLGALPKGDKQNLRRFARNISLSLVSSERAALERLFGDADRRGGDLAKAVYKAQQNVIQDLANVIADSAHHFPASAYSPVRIAEMLIASLYGWQAMRGHWTDLSEAKATEYADQVVDMLYRG